MKDFVKLTKETWQFYLTALGIILLLVVGNNMYILKETGLEGKSAGSLYFMADIFISKADGYDLINFWVAMAGIAVLLFVRHCSFMDKRTMEFQFLLPVKKRAVVLYDYLCNMGIIIIAWLVTMCTFAVTQGLHNNKAASMSEELRIGAVNAADKLWETGIYYLLYLIGCVTLLYLGSVICKNAIAGMIVMAVAWGMLWIINDIILYYSISEIYSVFEIWLSPFDFLAYILNSNIPDKRDILVILVGSILFMIVLIGIAAERRELSEGKWFYFRWMDHLIPVVCGSFAAFVLYDLFWESLSAALIAGIVVCGMLFWLLKRDGLAKKENWEVK